MKQYLKRQENEKHANYQKVYNFTSSTLQLVHAFLRYLLFILIFFDADFYLYFPT